MSCSFCKYLFNVNKVHITIKLKGFIYYWTGEQRPRDPQQTVEIIMRCYRYLKCFQLPFIQY